MTATVKLKPGVHHRSLWGHPWVFSNEIGDIDGDFQPGDIVSVESPKKEFVGLGYINPRSMISVRLLTRKDRPIDRDFFRDRLKQALEYRQRAFGQENFKSLGSASGGFRLVYSEADSLPGLIVDIFAGHMVFQTLTLGIDKWKEPIMEDLSEMVCPKGIYQRNDAPVRELEGLKMEAGFWGEPFDPLVEMDEYGVKIIVDVQKGQKTGYFLDQSLNRFLIRPLTRGRSLLDVFSYSGGFGLSASLGGAKEVHFIDASEAALYLAKSSAERNHFETQFKYTAGNAFDILRDFYDQGVRFDAISLDPPAFARSRRALEKALSGYKEINLRAMKLLRDGGFLFTSSCSHHIFPEEFDNMLWEAGRDAGKSLRLMDGRGARMDHPEILGVPETSYLKFRILQVMPE